MRRLITAGVVALGVVGFVGTPTASAQQQLSFAIGGFNPRGFDGRPIDDVLVNNTDFLAFNVSDFNGAFFGAEYLTALGNNFDAGLGIGYYKRSVPTVYTDFVNSDGTEIEQTLRLRIVPFTATFRFLPLGHHNGVEPYIGGGVGVFNYNYSETGQFLGTNNAIFNGTFVGSGTAVGPVILGGVRVPVGPVAVGGELRWQSAKGDLPADQDFAGNRIDLGGITYTFTINVRF
jgi:hypothetical protein